jgi:hypothetical protein
MAIHPISKRWIDITEETSMNLSILYTANIRGDLDLIPRLYTFLKELRRDMTRFRPEDEDVMLCVVQPPETRTLLLDMGNSCASDVWHCAATDGRSALIALDAMGYNAANVPNLSAESRSKLEENLLGMALVDAEHPWQDAGVLATGDAHSDLMTSTPYNLSVVLSPADATHLNNRILRLTAVNAGQVGTAYISSVDTTPVLSAHAIFDLPPNTPPDPTIAGAVDFIIREARRYQGNK